MPFTRPTLSEIRTRDEADMAAALGVGALLPRSAELALARSISGASHLLHGHIEWVSKQILPDTADSDWLDRHALRIGLKPTRKPATFAQGSVTFTGINGADIPAGTRVRRSDGGEYATDADATIASGTANVAVTALLAGSTWNIGAGAVLTLASPLLGVDTNATAGDLSGGTDRETDKDLLARIYQRAAITPLGGSADDYVVWALEVPGVTRAWCLPQYLGEPGRVGVTFARDNDLGGEIPDAGELAAVEAYLNDGRRPVTAKLTVFAPIALPLNPDVILTPYTAAVAAAVEAAVLDLIRREGGPGQTLLKSHFEEAVSLAAGETDHQTAWPTNNVVVPSNKLLTLGTPVWS